MAGSKVRDMTTGSIPPLILKFAVPMMFGNLFHQLYNMVDSIVVGNFVNAYALGAIGACGSLNSMTFGFCNGISVGIGVIISQLFGAGKKEKVRRTIISGAAMLLLIIAAFSCLCVAIAPGLLHLMHTPEEYVDQSILYFRIVCGGMLGVTGYNFVTAVLRALGDSRTPLLFLIAASILNVVLDLVFVLAFGMGVDGVAIATVISQLFSAIGCVIYARKSNIYFQMERKDLHPDRAIMSDCLRVGVPLGLQNSLISFSSVVLQRVVNGFGPATATAYTMTLRIEQIIHQSYSSLSAAISSFTGQNIGASNYDRVKQGLKVGLKITAVFSILMFFVMHLFGRQILSIFGNSEIILNIAVKANRLTSCFYFVLGVIYVIRGLCNGAGDSAQALVNGILEIVCRLVLSVLLTSIPAIGMWGIWMTTVSTWCITAAEYTVHYRNGKWKRKIKIL